MSQPGTLNVVPNERGCIRIFELDLSNEDLRKLKNPQGESPSTEAAVAHMLGLDWLNADYIEMFDVADLDELGLAGYLTQGNGVAPASIEADRTRLGEIKGWVLILYSSAFDGKSAQLSPNRQLSFVGTWQEARDQVSFEPLPSKAAKGIISQTPPVSNNPHLTVLWVILTLPIFALCLAAVIYGVTR